MTLPKLSDVIFSCLKDLIMDKTIERPVFANETEEANWWYEHREAHGEAFAKAIRERRARHSTLAQRVAESQTIQLATDDFEKAVDLAKARGVDWRVLVNSLVHQALENEVTR